MEKGMLAAAGLALTGIGAALGLAVGSLLRTPQAQGAALGAGVGVAVGVVLGVVLMLVLRPDPRERASGLRLNKDQDAVLRALLEANQAAAGQPGTAIGARPAANRPDLPQRIYNRDYSSVGGAELPEE